MLVAAVATWGTALLMSPHGPETAAGTEHVRAVVTTYIRNSAIGTILLSTLACWLLYPPRRPNRPWRDYAIAALLAILIVTSIYQIFWVRALG